MNAEIENALANVFRGFPAGTNAEDDVRALVSKAEAAGCGNLADKLDEYKGAATGGRMASLCAELRFAIVIAPLATSPPSFHRGAHADISFVTADGVFLLEVVHKSAPHPMSTVFYSEPVLVASYASATNWKASAYRLSVVLQSLPIAVTPWLESGFLKNEVGGKEREKQENACAALADWLATALPDAVAHGHTRLDYPGGDTYFDIKNRTTGPGYMTGFGPRDAWFVKDGAFGESIKDKASKASSRLIAANAAGYLIGLDIEDAVASSGYDIVSDVLGPSFFRGDPGTDYCYRPITATTRAQIDDAEQRGRADLLRLAHFDRRESNAHGHASGLYFDPGFSDVTAVIAVYYTKTIQFVPNPFSVTDVDLLRKLFPATLAPISEDELRAFSAARQT